ncbi:hypothetical protein ACJU26_05355 [Acidithiobacillus sp. M4-SHS-6]|uniref:hypothetical protein n=1 Tax=Acidithiobacillus sp. M4-SHS-6 TaxID=3383024 RepID=UPI0039BDD718
MEWITLPEAALKKEWESSLKKVHQLWEKLDDEYETIKFLHHVFVRKKILTEAIQRSIQHRAVTNK